MTRLKPCPFCGATGEDLWCLYMDYDEKDMRDIRFLMPDHRDVVKQRSEIMVSKIICSRCGCRYEVSKPEQLFVGWNKRMMPCNRRVKE